MSDVSMARAGWFWWCVFMIGVGVMWLWEQIPVLIRRGEYSRLRDNELMINEAHQALNENRKLRQQIGDLQ